MIISYYIISTNLFDRPGKEATICKINKFSIVTSMFVTSIDPKYSCTQLSCAKNSCRQLALVNLKEPNQIFLH